MMRNRLYHSLANVLRRHHDDPCNADDCPVCAVTAEIADVLEEDPAFDRMRFGVEAGVIPTCERGR